MPAAHEFIAHERTEKEIEQVLGADGLMFQDLNDLIETVHRGNRSIEQFDTSCFNHHYVTGDIDQAYLDQLEQHP